MAPGPCSDSPNLTSGSQAWLHDLPVKPATAAGPPPRPSAKGDPPPNDLHHRQHLATGPWLKLGRSEPAGRASTRSATASSGTLGTTEAWPTRARKRVPRRPRPRPRGLSLGRCVGALAITLAVGWPATRAALHADSPRPA